MNIKEQKIKDLSLLYDTLLERLEVLSNVKTIEEGKDGLDTLKQMNELHLKTREFAKELLSYDFSELAPNFLLKPIFKEINKQSILFINLITKYLNDMITHIENNDKESFDILIKDIIDFNEVAKKQFEPLKKALDKM